MLKPELRQNFTIDQSVLLDAAEGLNISKDDRIIEIGPGKGVLTLEIIKKLRKSGLKIPQNEKDLHLLSYEVDNDLREDLEAIKRRNSDIYDYRIQSFLEAKAKTGFNKCTGNIPYHISEPLFFKFIEWDFDEICMITGIRFARKTTGEFEGKIATISNYLFESKILKEYDKNIFYPRSKVDSALLFMKKKTEFENEKDKMIAFIFKNIFNKHNWLNKYLGYDQGQTGQIYHMALDKLIETIKNH